MDLCLPAPIMHPIPYHHPTPHRPLQVTVIVRPAGVVAAIAGGDRDVGLLSSWSLSASSSIDVDATTRDVDVMTCVCKAARYVLW